jgi:hypothetical protein
VHCGMRSCYGHGALDGIGRPGLEFCCFPSVCGFGGRDAQRMVGIDRVLGCEMLDREGIGEAGGKFVSMWCLTCTHLGNG